MILLSNSSHWITKLYKGKCRDKLLRLMSRDLMSVGINAAIIEAVINEFPNGSDKKIINYLRKMVKRPVNLYDNANNDTRAQRKVFYVDYNLNRRIHRMLDFGGNVGHFAANLGRKHKINKKNRHVIDISNWGGRKWKPRNDISFTDYKYINTDKDKILSGESKVDLITSFHVLHHIKDSDLCDIVEYFNKILSKKGDIILFEHDVVSKDMTALIDLEHCLFDVVVSQVMTYDKFIKTYIANYKSVAAWKKLFSKYFHVSKIHKTKSPNESTYIFLRR